MDAVLSGMHSCNCMYGSQDPRCCINRAQRQALEEAWRLGRQGKPLPESKWPIYGRSWVEFSNGFSGQDHELIKRGDSEVQPAPPVTP